MKVSEEMYKLLLDQQTSNSNLSLIVSALILAVNYAHLTIDKVSIAGADISIKDPFVISGALGIILIYSVLVSIRFLFAAPQFARMIDPEHVKQMGSVSKLGYASMFIPSLAMVFVQLAAAMLALCVAWPSIVRLFAVALGTHS
ncbi:MAG: hypothetical protein WC026_11070 [Hyphomicrobium sp.]|uniref:hypothetical protein n=1 Tax=Hyphomicrobium sp. TaxID=82 RepID=UPI003563B0D0